MASCRSRNRALVQQRNSVPAQKRCQMLSSAYPLRRSARGSCWKLWTRLQRQPSLRPNCCHCRFPKFRGQVITTKENRMPSLEVSTGFEEKTLELVVQSPAAAMMLLWSEVDRQLRLILAAVGKLESYKGQSPGEALDLIAQVVFIPTEIRSTIDSFWRLRNMAVHGESLSSTSAVRAVDYGFRIVRMLQNIARPSLIVVTTVPVFSDPECNRKRQGIKGVIVDHFDTKGGYLRRVFPTRKDYSSGQSLSWEWEVNGPSFEESWYRDPESGQVKPAWRGNFSEFTGRPLEDI